MNLLKILTMKQEEDMIDFKKYNNLFVICHWEDFMIKRTHFPLLLKK